MVTAARVLASAVLAAVVLVSATPANAEPSADSFAGVCELLANGDDYNLAVMSVESDTGLGLHDSMRFVNKAIRDHCPAFRNLTPD